jgi:hypothetical protein
VFCYKIAEASFLFKLSVLFPVSSLCGISLMIDGIGKCIGLCMLSDIISIPNYTIFVILKSIMKLSVGDVKEITIIDAQLEDFKKKAKFFGSPIAMAALETKIAAQWWESYGDEHPELQNFAICVLSLTCISSGCERN